LVLSLQQRFVDICRGMEVRMALGANDRATALAESVALFHELNESSMRGNESVEAVSRSLCAGSGRDTRQTDPPSVNPLRQATAVRPRSDAPDALRLR
jgi:hypothetical protein